MTAAAPRLAGPGPAAGAAAGMAAAPGPPRAEGRPPDRGRGAGAGGEAGEAAAAGPSGRSAADGGGPAPSRAAGGAGEAAAAGPPRPRGPVAPGHRPRRRGGGGPGAALPRLRRGLLVPVLAVALGAAAVSRAAAPPPISYRDPRTWPGTPRGGPVLDHHVSNSSPNDVDSRVGPGSHLNRRHHVSQEGWRTPGATVPTAHGAFGVVPPKAQPELDADVQATRVARETELVGLHDRWRSDAAKGAPAERSAEPRVAGDTVRPRPDPATMRHTAPPLERQRVGMADVIEPDCNAQAATRTLAGLGVPGVKDGYSGRGRFEYPWGVAVGAGGTVYVADTGNNKVRALEPGSRALQRNFTFVSSFAGFGVPGDQDGPAIEARFRGPKGMAVHEGVLYLADSGNNVIRAINLTDPEHRVSTFAGAGPKEHADSRYRANARFANPSDLCVDKPPFGDGSLYVADTDNHVIRRVHPNIDGLTETVAGKPGRRGKLDSRGKRATFDTPLGITVDSRRRMLYVADSRNGLIRTVSIAAADYGEVGTLAGAFANKEQRFGDTDGIGPTVAFREPSGIAHNGSFVYVADRRAHRISRVNTTDGHSDYLAGGLMFAMGLREGIGTAALFDHPSQVVVEGGRLIVADTNSHAVRELVLEEPTLVKLRIEGHPVQETKKCFFLPGSPPCRALVCDRSHYVRAECNAVIDAYCAPRPAGQQYDPGCSVHGYGPANQEAHHPRQGPTDTAFPSYRNDFDELRAIGTYSVNGAPDNGTSLVQGHVLYHGEVQDVQFCAYPSAAYGLSFQGQINVTVSQRAPGAAAEAEDFVLHYAEAQLAEPTTVTLRLKGRGCTDPAAANYNPFATEDDGSCARAHLVRLEVKARGQKGFYAIDGPGLYYEENLLPLPAGMEEDEVQTLDIPMYPGTFYHLVFNGNVSATIRDARTGQQFLAYEAPGDDARHFTKFRPPAPGCMHAEYANYSPLATADDGTCVMGSNVTLTIAAAVNTTADVVRYDPACANTSCSGTAERNPWFLNGAYVPTTPGRTGGRTWLAAPHMFQRRDETHSQTLKLAPGRYDVLFYGKLAGNVTLDADNSTLLRFNATEDTNLFRDEDRYENVNLVDHVGEGPDYEVNMAIATFEVPIFHEGVATAIGYEGGTIGSPEGARLIIPEGATDVFRYVKIELVDPMDDRTRRAMMEFPLKSRVYRILPPNIEFLKPVEVVLPLLPESVPDKHGGDGLAAIVAPDAERLNWRGNGDVEVRDGLVHFRTMSVTLAAVIARPAVTHVAPPEVRAGSGAVLDVAGVHLAPLFELSGKAASTAAWQKAGLTFCQFEDTSVLYTRADHVPAPAAGLPPGRDLAQCATPALRPGFATVELLFADLFLASVDDRQFLLREPARLLAAFPDAVLPGASTLVRVRGTHLHGVMAEPACSFQHGNATATVVAEVHSSALVACELNYHVPAEGAAAEGVAAAAGKLRYGDPAGRHGFDGGMAYAAFPAPRSRTEEEPCVGSSRHGRACALTRPGPAASWREAAATPPLECRVGAVTVRARDGPAPACHVPSLAPGEYAVALSHAFAIVAPAVGRYVALADEAAGFALANEVVVGDGHLLEFVSAVPVTAAARAPDLSAFRASECDVAPAGDGGFFAAGPGLRHRRVTCPVFEAVPGFQEVRLGAAGHGGSGGHAFIVAAAPEVLAVYPGRVFQGDVVAVRGTALRGPGPGPPQLVAWSSTVGSTVPAKDNALAARVSMDLFLYHRTTLRVASRRRTGSQGGDLLRFHTTTRNPDLECLFGSVRTATAFDRAAAACVVPALHSQILHFGIAAVGGTSAMYEDDYLEVVDDALAGEGLHPEAWSPARPPEVQVFGRVLGIPTLEHDVQCHLIGGDGGTAEARPLVVLEEHDETFAAACRLPPGLSVGMHTVELRLPESHVAEARFDFLVPSRAAALSVQPQAAAAGGAAALITVVGENFLSHHRCAAGGATRGQIQGGTIVSSSLLVCELDLDAADAPADLDAAARAAPPRPGTGRTVVSVAGFADREAGAAGAAGGGGTLLLDTFQEPRVLAAAPARGELEGGTTVVVTGADFPGGKVGCKFGSIFVGGLVVNATHLECVTPAATEGTVGLRVGTPSTGGGYLASVDFKFI